MSHLSAVRALLVADTAVSDLVDDRIYPSIAKQGTARPFIVLRMISDVPAASFTGLPSELLSTVRMQVDCYADGYEDAHDLADAVDAVLGAQATTTLSATRESSQDVYDDTAGKSGLHGVSSDYLVWR